MTNKEIPEQDTREWIELRKNHIGASDAPVIMEVNKKYSGQVKTTPIRLWKEKLGLETRSIDTVATRYGKSMEAPARTVYEKMQGVTTPATVVFSKEYDFMMASLDGFDKEKNVAVEIKNCGVEDHDTAKKGYIPDHYYPQLQHQMICAGLDTIDYFSYHKGEGILVQVKKDEKYCAELIEKEKAFWAQVMDLDEPALTKDDYVKRGEEWKSVAMQLWEVKENIKKSTAQAKDLTDRLKELSENHCSRSGEYSFTFSSCKGSVDYSSIPALENVDLEKFRKKSTTRVCLNKERG